MSFTDNATKDIDGGVSAGTVTEGHCLRVSHLTDFEDSPYVSREVTISQAELVALTTAQKTIIPAPGAGKVIHFISGSVQLNYSGTGNNTESAANLVLKYTADTGVAVSEIVEMTGFITQTADYYTNILGIKDNIVAGSAAVNAAVVMDNNGSGDFGTTGGTPTSSLRVCVVYSIHDAA